MSNWSFSLGTMPSSGNPEFREADNAVWLATTAGAVLSCRLLDGAVRTHGTGYVAPIAALPAPDGLGVYIIERGGRILLAYREEADAAQAVLLTDLQHPIAAARLHPDGGALLVVGGGPAGMLMRVDVLSGTATPLIADLGIAHGAISDMAVDEAGGYAVLLRREPAGAGLVVVDLAAVTAETVSLAGPADASFLVVAPQSAGGGLIVAGAAGDLVRVGLDGQVMESGPSLATPIRGLSRWGSLILAVSEDQIVAQEWNIDAGILRFSSPSPAFVFGYLPMLIDLAAAGIGREDLDLIVEEGPDAGSVSMGIEAPRADGRLPYLVLAGFRTGEAHVLARNKVTGAKLGRARFRVQSTWPDQRSGPAIAITGEQRHYAFGTWGGGPPIAQNINVLPAPEVFRVALVLVETKDRGFGPDPSAIRNTWADRLVGANSVRTYYEEISLLGTPPGGPVKGTTVKLVGDRVFGPIVMPNAWADYFEDRGKPWKGWLSKQDARQAFATAFCESLMDQGISDPILRNTDAVVFLVRTASDQPGKVGDKDFTAKFAWPSANGAKFNYKTEFATSQRPIPLVVAPDDYPSGMPMGERFPWIAMLCHELGHNLGLEDLYDAQDRFPAEVDVRAVGAMDLMGDGWPHPNFSLPNRMRLGWIDPTWIERIDFATNPNGRTVVLQAASALARPNLPAGRKAGVEVRIRDGWNYYFEYRRTRAGQLGDQKLNAYFGASALIAGLDVMSGGNPEAARPIIQLVPADPDGDGPILDSTGEDFDDSDLTNPGGMHDFRLIFDQIEPGDPQAARVRIEYVRARRPELQIRPAPGNGNWKSPDIDITNQAGANRVAKGLPHTVIIRVRNAGVRAATQVRVAVQWLPFTLSSGGTWQSLPDPPRLDLAPGEEKEFRTTWNVPASVKIGDVEIEHFCLRADIDRYVDPTNPAESEIVIHNNWAQSNFDTNSIGSGSPSDRIRTGVGLSNGLGRVATYCLDAVQDSPHFRLFIGNAWLRLDPNETRVVDLAYETLAADPVHGAEFDRAFGERGLRDPDRVSISAFVLPADGLACRSPRLWWGVNLALHAGWRTKIGRFVRTGEVIRGYVGSDAGGSEHGVPEGTVSVALWLDDNFDDRHALRAELESDGQFTVLLSGDLLVDLQAGAFAEAEVFYLGTRRYAASRSGRRRLS